MSNTECRNCLCLTCECNSALRDKDSIENYCVGCDGDRNCCNYITTTENCLYQYHKKEEAKKSIEGKEYKIGDEVNMKMYGFMGIEFPCKATIVDVCYKLRTDTGNGQYSECVLNKQELEESLIK